MLAEAAGTTYSGAFVENQKNGWGSEKMLDTSTFEGPFFENRRHGIGTITTMVPVHMDENASWEMPDDDGWIKEWTVDKPELRGEELSVCIHMFLCARALAVCNSYFVV